MKLLLTNCIFQNKIYCISQPLVYNPVFQLEFDEPVFVITVNIYETSHAVVVKSIKAMAKEGDWQNLWTTNKDTYISVYLKEISQE